MPIVLKNPFLFLVFLITVNKLKAQYDTIVYVNGTKQAAKIIEINKKVVKFKNPKDTLGPTFVINIKNIERFNLKSGCVDLKQMGYLNCVKDPMFGVIKNEDFTKNIISIDVLQIFDKHLQVSYEHIFKSRLYGIVGYYNHGFTNATDSFTYNRLECKVNGGVYYKNDFAGLDFKFYPGVHKKNTFWLALGVEAGAATNLLTGYYSKTAAYQNGTLYYTNLRNPYPYYENKLYIGYHTKVGFLYRINKHFICQGSFGAGVSQFAKDQSPDASEPNPAGNAPKYAYYIKISAGLLLGYAF